MEKFHKKVFSRLKKDFRKLKYLDRTRASYFIVTSFISAFCLFTGATYSYFSFTKSINAATITIANLSYNLSSDNSKYSNGVVNVNANETVILNLKLRSLNKIETKYAMKYETLASGVKVYYSQNLQNNMKGTIGLNGSEIDMRIVIENKGSSAAQVILTALGGYTKNNLDTNIIEGYYESDIIIRSVLLNNGLTNGTLSTGFPARDSGYIYFRSVCTEPVTTKWNNSEWKLELLNLTKQVSCDAYFKKMDVDADGVESDIETYYILVDKNGKETFVDEVPTTGYTYRTSSCNNDSSASWDESTRKITITGITEKTICVSYFDEI